MVDPQGQSLRTDIYIYIYIYIERERERNQKIVSTAVLDILYSFLNNNIPILPNTVVPRCYRSIRTDKFLYGNTRFATNFALQQSRKRKRACEQKDVLSLSSLHVSATKSKDVYIIHVPQWNL
jgi:hypothetical protein